jgi:hypothetical protein
MKTQEEIQNRTTMFYIYMGSISLSTESSKRL